MLVPHCWRILIKNDNQCSKLSASSKGDLCIREERVLAFQSDQDGQASGLSYPKGCLDPVHSDSTGFLSAWQKNHARAACRYTSLAAEEDGTYHFLLLKYPTQQTWPAQTMDMHAIGSFLLNTPVSAILTNWKQRRGLQGWLFSALVYQPIKLCCREI